MSANPIALKWKRPESSEYPKVWHRFSARDVNSDKLVEYRIEDLCIERASDAYNHMRENFFRDEPIGDALNGYEDENYMDDFIYGWKAIFDQKTPVVCYRSGLDEIVGINWTFVECKEDKFFEKVYSNCKSSSLKCFIDLSAHLYKDFDLYEHYGVDKYMASIALSVDRKYRGRGIGEQLIGTRKIMCQEFGVKLTQTVFSSDFSSRNAENLGFKTNRQMSYDELYKIFPQYDLRSIKSKGMSIKTLVY